MIFGLGQSDSWGDAYDNRTGRQVPIDHDRLGKIEIAGLTSLDLQHIDFTSPVQVNSFTGAYTVEVRDLTVAAQSFEPDCEFRFPSQEEVESVFAALNPVNPTTVNKASKLESRPQHPRQSLVRTVLQGFSDLINRIAPRR